MTNQPTDTDTKKDVVTASVLHRITLENAAFLSIDYMHGLISAVRSIDPA